MTASDNERFLEIFRTVKMYSTTRVLYGIASERAQLVCCILVVYTEKNSLFCKYFSSLYKVNIEHVFFMTYNSINVYWEFHSDVVSF